MHGNSNRPTNLYYPEPLQRFLNARSYLSGFECGARQVAESSEAHYKHYLIKRVRQHVPEWDIPWNRGFSDAILSAIGA